MGKKDINLWPILGLILASPLLLIIFLITGVFAIGRMIALLTNPLSIALVLIISAVFYYKDKLSVSTITFTGLFVGFLWWVIGIAQFYMAASWLCGIPLLGGLLCGAITLVSAFTDLIGYILGGLVLSAFIGGFLYFLKR